MYVRVVGRNVGVVALLLAVPGRAEEKAPPRVALVDVRPTEGATNAQAAQIRDALSASLRNFRIDLVEDHPAVRAAQGPGAEASMAPGISQARQRAREGKKLFDDLDPAGAEKKFREAADLFEANAGALSSSGDLIGTYLYLARVFFATEREVLARDIFKRVVQLQPDLTLDRAVYPPGMIQVFEDVKKLLLSSPLGSLRVDSKPSPSRVFLDGRERGTAPLDLVNIPAGVHTLTVRRPGFAPWVRPVDVTTFRVDTITAPLELDRHPSLEQLFLPEGAALKDTLGTTVADYLDVFATETGLDVVLVGRAAKRGKDLLVDVLPYRRDGKRFGEKLSVSFSAAPGRPPMDAFASQILGSLAKAGWIPLLAARKKVSAGGGALDETARFGVRVSFAPGARVAGAGRNFPDAPAAGIRVGADYRLSSRVSLGLETGYDALVENGAALTDSAGNVAISRGQGVQSLYTSVPLDLGVRYNIGVGTFAPYLSATAGVRWDRLAFREPLPFDELKGSSGLGFAGSLGLGGEYALGTRSALFAEARVHAGTVGVEKVTVNITTTPENPDRELPVDAGTYVGLRVQLGFLRVF